MARRRQRGEAADREPGPGSLSTPANQLCQASPLQFGASFGGHTPFRPRIVITVVCTQQRVRPSASPSTARSRGREWTHVAAVAGDEAALDDVLRERPLEEVGGLADLLDHEVGDLVRVDLSPDVHADVDTLWHGHNGESNARTRD